MKYICTEGLKGKREIFIFPKSVDHDKFAEDIAHLKHTSDNGSWSRILRTPVSAGFVTPDLRCIGESITLGLEANEHDTELLHNQLNPL